MAKLLTRFVILLVVLPVLLCAFTYWPEQAKLALLCGLLSGSLTLLWELCAP